MVGIPIVVVESGPFKGRAYEVRPDGGLGRRRPDADPRPAHATQRVRAMVGAIRDVARLDEILSAEPNPITRDAMLEMWRPWLRFPYEHGSP